MSTGLAIRQHAPRYFGNNSILLFDIWAGQREKGGSRIVEIDLASREMFYVVSRCRIRLPELNFFTRKPAMSILIRADHALWWWLTMEGRVLEIDLQTREVLWQYDHIFDVTKYMELTGQGHDQTLCSIWNKQCVLRSKRGLSCRCGTAEGPSVM